ncbi:hypothetical protein BG000_002558 [Podila horticola]|nr:hypothetical protein BG000_002558 [Podila horticola]
MSAVYTYLESLAKEPYFLPSIVVSVSIAVLITYLQDKPKNKDEHQSTDSKPTPSSDPHQSATATDAAPKPKAFALPTTELPPPNTTRVFTHEELAKHDGKDSEAPIYVAIKGTVFDVSTKRAMYGPGAGYSCFAGKDASKALGKSSLKIEECVADYSELTEKELKVLNDWYSFFEKRYPIVGKTEA